MEQPQVHHRLSGFLFLWMVLCCLVTVVRSDRVMWVDTKGEDGPQCIHHTPVGALMAQPPPSRSCRSLWYALNCTQNTTAIKITCGTHGLQPYPVDPYKPFPADSFALTIEGECATSQPTVQCLNGATAALTGVVDVMIKDIMFRDCGKNEDPKPPAYSVPRSPTLYFSRCTNVSVHNVTVHITGQYGTGIVLTNIVTHGVITLYDVSVLHNGTYGYGIICNIHGRFQTAIKNCTVHLNNIQVVNTNTHTEYDPSMKFDGIYISAQGKGSYNNISLHNVTVFNSAPVAGSGISIGLFQNMHINTVQLVGVRVFDGWDKHYQSKNRTQVLAECARRQLEMIQRQPEDLVYISIYIHVQTLRNSVNVTGVHVGASYSKNVVALSVTLDGLAIYNEVHLSNNVSLAITGNQDVLRNGLSLFLAEDAYKNMVIIQDLSIMNYTTAKGHAVILLFVDQCSGNAVKLDRITIANHHASIADSASFFTVFQDHAQNNKLLLQRAIIENNTAIKGGGIFISLRGSSSGNRVFTFLVFIGGNKAYAGGGMFIEFTDFSTENTMLIDRVYVANNTLLPTSNKKLGGGISVYYETHRATFPTKNKVRLYVAMFSGNKAKGGVGGGLSVIYEHSPYIEDRRDKILLNRTYFINNQAHYGSAFAMQSSPQFRKTQFRGISSIQTFCAIVNDTYFIGNKSLYTTFKHFVIENLNSRTLITSEFLLDFSKMNEMLENFILDLKRHYNAFFQIQTSTNMIFLLSVQIWIEGNFMCAAASQGLLVVDSEIILPPDSHTEFRFCVASHGGAIALYGESYIRVSTNSKMILSDNHAFQRGGAIYVHSPQHVVPHVRCFLQSEHGHSLGHSGIAFLDNSAQHEGQSVYLSESESCFNNVTKNRFIGLQAQSSYNFAYERYAYGNRTLLTLFPLCTGDSRIYIRCNATEPGNTTHAEFHPIVSRPDHVDGTSVDINNPPTIQFIPGKQKQLPHKHAYDRLGNVITTVFTVQINTPKPTADVQLNPFSKYTADFTVILHGIPLKHGSTKHDFSTTNESNTTGDTTPRDQLVLESVDNSNLMLVMNIELQCCPPGYIYRIGSGDMGTCHCGMPMVPGIEGCNETDPNNIGAVLQGNHWVGYLQSNGQHSCDGQKLFTAPCPPGYCQTQVTILPTNNSMEKLENVICGRSNRKGLLCGDCLEGSSIAVNFNGMRPVCTSCQDGLSTVGLLVWILSEWVPMLVVMFTVMLFNIDLVSGRFNSFLLFAQLLAFSSIRGDAELGTVHIAFVKIYRFLYGIWNLDFFGVLLPPYCLIPHSHLTLLQTLLLHYSIGLFPLIVAITLIVLERSAEKWICCHRVDQCLRRMRRWKAKYSDGMSYDRALPAFVILGFTRFLVSSSYILVNQTITGEDGEERMVVWWQGSVPYGSIQHIAYFIPAIIILLVFVLLPAFLLLTLPIVPQLFGRLIITVPPLRKLQRMQTFCSNVYTDRWIYHFVNVFQGCYKERLRSFSSVYLFYRIIHLVAAVFIPRAEDGLCIQLLLTLVLSQLIVIFQPYSASHLNILDTAILGNLSLILVLSLLMNNVDTLSGTKQFYASVRMFLIYLPLLYPGILFGRKVYLKCPIGKLRCCQTKEEIEEDDVEPLLDDPTEGLGNFVRITELRAGTPTSSDEESETETQSEEVPLENQNKESVVVDLAI